MAKKPRKKFYKTPSPVLNERRIKVAEWMADGLGRADIIRNSTKEDPPWNVTSRTIDEYMAFVWKDWKQLYADERGIVREEAVAVRKRLYVRCLKKGDMRTALSARDSLDKIRGVLVDRNLNMNLDSEKSFELTPEEEKRLARELGVVFKKK